MLILICLPLRDGLKTLRSNGAIDFVITQLTHEEWHGNHYIDHGFSGFLFVIGAAVAVSQPRDLRSIVKRTAILFAFGVFCTGGFAKPITRDLMYDVMQRLAICYLAVALATRYLSLRAQIISVAVVLAVYGLVTHFVPFPGAIPDRYDATINLASYIDSPGRKPPPEGAWSTIGAICTTWCGALAGQAVRDLTPSRRLRRLALFAVVSLGVALLLAIWVPINKRMWTVSFHFAGLAFVCVHWVVFVQLAEIWKLRKPLFPILVVGMNPLTAYLVATVLPMQNYAQRFVPIELRGTLGSYFKPLIGVTILILIWLILYALHRRKLYLRA